jgi:hypothetical protein
MTAPDYVTVNGQPVTSARVVVGYTGPWHAEVTLPSDAAIGPAVTLRIGELTLVGTVLADSDGTVVLRRMTRIVGGAGGWSSTLVRKGYHNDAGIKARLIADDAAREVGESIGSFVPRAERVGVDFARADGLASRALEASIGEGIAWWVDYAGITNVGARPAHAPDVATYQVLAYDPAQRIATLTANDASIVQVGSTISEGLDVPGTVRELEIVASGSEPLRMTAWLGGSGQDMGRLAGLLTRIAQRTADVPLWGTYRYRVVTQGPDERLTLQAVQPRPGLPDIGPVTVWPGVPGVHGDVALGGEVLVTFVDGDPAQPLVTAFAPFGSNGFTPTELVIGGDVGMPAARQQDAVEVLLPPAVVTGTLGAPVNAPITGVLIFNTQKAVGIITGGSPIVSIAP